MEKGGVALKSHSRKSANKRWWNFFNSQSFFPPMHRQGGKKSNFRDKPYWRPYNCEVHEDWGGLFINEGSRVYSTPIRSPFKKHLCHLAKICGYVCLLYTFNCDCSLFLFFCHWHFCWIWLLFTRKLQANKKLIHFCKHSKSMRYSSDDFCLLLMENPQQRYAPPSSFSPGKNLFISPISIWQLTFLLPECPKIIKHLTLA